MKKNLLLTAVLIAFIINAVSAQKFPFNSNFDDLIVPESGYFNGSTEHSGTIGSTETFFYISDWVQYYVNYTLEDGYDYWSGMAYSNQTDLITADWLNYSAYANNPDGGGAEESVSYGFAYINTYLNEPVNIMMELPVKETGILGFYVCNSVWAYHYMNGTDGVGNGTYETGDFFKLIFTLNYKNGNKETFDFYLADFTNGNSYIIDDWTFVDLSSYNAIYEINVTCESTDELTPTYFCIDNISGDVSGIIQQKHINRISLYPNPAKNIVHIQNVLNTNISVIDITGKTVYTKTNCFENEQINVSNLVSGIYFVQIENRNQTFTKKLIVE